MKHFNVFLCNLNAIVNDNTAKTSYEVMKCFLFFFSVSRLFHKLKWQQTKAE